MPAPSKRTPEMVEAILDAMSKLAEMFPWCIIRKSAIDGFNTTIEQARVREQHYRSTAAQIKWRLDMCHSLAHDVEAARHIATRMLNMRKTPYPLDERALSADVAKVLTWRDYVKTPNGWQGGYAQ